MTERMINGLRTLLWWASQLRQKLTKVSVMIFLMMYLETVLYNPESTVKIIFFFAMKINK